MMIIFSTKYAAIRKLVLIVYAAITLLLVVAAIALALSPAYNVLYFFNPLQRIEEVPYSVNDVPRGTLELPSTITRLAPGDKVSIFLESRGFEQDNLLLEVDYAHCILTIADEPYFEVGGEGTYPEFQREPPFSIDIVALPGVNAGTVMRLDYTLSPINDSLEIKPLYLGDQNLITKRVLMDNYLALLLSVVMLILGVALCIIGMAFLSRAELATALVWLGLTCIACGCWTLFANKVVLLYFSQFSVFYTASLVGLFVLPIPLARFGIAFLEPYRTRLLDTLFIVSCLAFPALLALHVSGLFSLGQAAPWLKSIGLLFLAFYIIFVIVMQQRKGVSVSPLFIFGITLFAVLAFVDGASGYIGLGSPVGTFFMIGLLFATVVIALLVWEYMSDALDALEKNARLEADISSINRSLDLQRKHFQDFASSVEETRRMRHDLRHQLVAIKGFVSEGKDREAFEYIDMLSQSIPSIAEMLVCDNVAVNSLAIYYRAQAVEQHIHCDVKMVVPPVVGRIPDGDLSIIVGNLFENALEACMHVSPEKRFIKIRGNIVANRFMLTIDNSFDGEYQVSGLDFYSRKRNGFGVGIASVRSVVSKFDGSMKYEAESGVFKTSLYVKI